MPTQIPYDRSKAAAYAEKWAFSRNPRYISFDGMGGDCTSFVSQCLYAGTGVMNFTRDTGWYYNSASDRAAAWSGVPYLYRFLAGNRSVGPYGRAAALEELERGDLIQLGDASDKWYHSLFVTEVTGDDILVSTHTFDAYRRPPLKLCLRAGARHPYRGGAPLVSDSPESRPVFAGRGSSFSKLGVDKLEMVSYYCVRLLIQFYRDRS